MVSVVVEQTLSVAVEVFGKKELVGVAVQTESELNHGVGVEIPSFTLSYKGGEHPSLVGRDKLYSCLENTIVIQDVAVVFAVDDGNPELTMHDYARRDLEVSPERYLIP